jgi:hypothetical protein
MLVTIIQDIVEALEYGSPAVTPTFVSGWKRWQNIAIDNLLTDVVILDTPLRSNDTLTRGSYTEENYVINIAFFRKSELDYTPEQHEIIVDVMRGVKEKFIYALRQDERIRNVTNASTQDVFNAFNVNLSGCLLTITVTPYGTYSKC